MCIFDSLDRLFRHHVALRPSIVILSVFNKHKIRLTQLRINTLKDIIIPAVSGVVKVMAVVLYVKTAPKHDILLQRISARIGVIMFLRGVFDLVSTFSPHDKSSLLSKALKGSIDPAWLVFPKQEEPLSVKDVERNIARYSCLHIYYNEALLKQPVRSKGKEGSKAAAIDVIRTWVRDPSING